MELTAPTELMAPTEPTATAAGTEGREASEAARFSWTTASADLAMSRIEECWRAATLALGGRASNSITSKRSAGSGRRP